MRNIEITRKYEFVQETWTFWLNHDDMSLYLDSYNHGIRMPNKRKYEIDKRYYRIDQRCSNITAKEVFIPDDVKAEALKTIVDQLAVKIWPER